MLEFDTVKGWLGKRVVGSDGEAIGRFEEVYLDRQSGQPEWAAIRTGLFGSKVSFAPLEGAGVDGDDVRIAYAKSAVKDAPNVEADGELTPDEEERLFEHYGRADYSEWDARADATESAMGRDERWGRDEDSGTGARLDDDGRGGERLRTPGSADGDDRERKQVGGGLEPRERDTSPELGDRDRGALGGQQEVRGLGDLPIQPRRARLRRYIVTEEVIVDDRGREDAHVVDRELLEDDKR
jgi:sporulation protein YlmC with PRC-barrel domain